MRTCRYCGCSFKDGKGVNSKGKKFTTAGVIINICMLGFPIICGVPTLQNIALVNAGAMIEVK